MAQLAGTSDVYNAKGLAQDFREVIYTIAKEETPFQKMIGSTYDIKATRHNWQVDALDPPAQNAVPEGNDATFSKVTPTREMSNYCQISEKTFVISETYEAVKKYGRKSELKRQTLKKAKELARDMEYALVGLATPSSAGSGTDPIRFAGSLPTWLTSNVSRAPDGGNGGYNPAMGTTSKPVDGKLRTFVEAQVKVVQQLCFDQGATPNIIMMHSSLKPVFSSMTGIAVNRVNHEPSRTRDSQAVILGAADIYQGDFGKLAAIANPWQRRRDIYLLDPDMLELGFLRGIKQEPLAKTGDAEKRLVNCEWTLIVKNEASCGIIADLQAA